MQDSTCVVDGCPKPVHVKARGLCRPHYEQQWKDGFTEAVPKGPAPSDRRCTIPGCSNRHKAHDLCRMHLDQAHARGELLDEDMQCSFDGCGRPRVNTEDGLCLPHLRQKRKGQELRPIRQYNKRTGTCPGPECGKPVKETVEGVGYCSGHGFQVRTGKPLTAITRTNLKGGPCIVDGCDRIALTKDGVCRPHNDRRREGDADWDQRVIPPKAPNGAGHLNEFGYRIISVDGRNVAEHRHKMEQLLGHPLKDGQTVHHRNGNRADNTTRGPLRLTREGKLQSGNLEIWSTSQPAGQEIGPKLDWAAEMQEEYTEFLRDEYMERMAAVLRARGYRVERAGDE